MTEQPHQNAGRAMIPAVLGMIAFAQGRNPGLTGIWFDLRGFWHSFSAILFILPMVLINHYVLAQFSQSLDFDPLRHILTSLIAWPVFAIALAPAASVLGFKSLYVPLIVMDHWLSVVQTAIMVMPVGLLWVGLPVDLFQPTYLAGFVVSLWLGWRGYRAILNTAGQTLFCMVYNLVLVLSMHQFLDALFK